MADINQIIDKAKELAECASEKSQIVYQVSKLKIEIAQLKSKLEKNYSSIGKKVYDSTKAEEALPDFAASIEEIDLLLAEIEEKKDLVSALKETVRCSACGADMRSDDPICPNCGAQK